MTAASTTHFGLARASLIPTAIATVDPAALDAFLAAIEDGVRNESRIWILGNGGSAAISDHFATDLAKVNIDTGLGILPVSLCSNGPVLTALSNDYGYEDAFAHQVRAYAKAGDLVVAVSSSGNSENVIRAIQQGKDNGATTVGLSGFDGGRLAKESDISIHVRTDVGDYGTTEDAHSVICHAVSLQLRELGERERTHTR
ncbi:MAG: D-sedoheptulose-7-phosphate isomerase [Mycobacterium sp.]